MRYRTAAGYSMWTPREYGTGIYGPRRAVRPSWHARLLGACGKLLQRGSDNTGARG